MAARDVQATTGKNLKLIEDLSGLDPWVAKLCDIVDALVSNETVPVPAADQWRLPYLCSLLRQRSEAYYSGKEEEVSTLSSYVDSLVAN